MKNKPKPRPRSFSYRLLLLSILLGISGGVTAILIALLVRGVKVDSQGLGGSAIAFIGFGMATIQTNRRNSSDSDDSDFDVVPNKPKPFNPPPFKSVREVENIDYVEMGKEILSNPQATQTGKMSMKQLLELSYDDKPTSNTPNPVSTFKVDLPTYAPYQVLALVNGDTATAMRLYEGTAKRNYGKSEQWVWDKVVSDLERDRK